MIDKASACRELWRAVFLRAVADAIVGREIIKSQAVKWLFSDRYETDRDMVCDLAGIAVDGWQVDLREIIENHRNLDMQCSKKKISLATKKFFIRHATND